VSDLISERLEKLENNAYDIVARKVVRLGGNAGVFVTKLIFFKEDAGIDFGLQDWTL
jgi:hypothetical protein